MKIQAYASATGKEFISWETGEPIPAEEMNGTVIFVEEIDALLPRGLDWEEVLDRAQSTSIPDLLLNPQELRSALTALEGWQSMFEDEADAESPNEEKLIYKIRSHLTPRRPRQWPITDPRDIFVQIRDNLKPPKI